MSNEQNTPYGYCHCGCGSRTPIATRTRSGRGQHRGEPLKFLPSHNRRRRFIDYEVDPETGCWNWSKTITSNGYGVIKKKGYRQLMAHRFVYELKHGPVDPSKDMDHLCRNRRCVNPDHLEPVSRSENLRRGSRGRTTHASIMQMRIADASTNMNRSEIAEMFGVSGQTVGRYLGKGYKNMYHRRKERPWGAEHRLLTSNRVDPYPDI